MPRPTGRPPKPIEEKIRTGNPGHRKLPTRATLTVLPGASKPPEPHRPLNPVGRELWDRIWTSPAAWLADRVDNEHVLILCEQLDERDTLRKLITADTIATMQAAKDQDRVLPTRLWRERSALRQLDAQISEGLSLLGFNPVERARLGVSEVKRAHSAVDDFFGSTS